MTIIVNTAETEWRNTRNHDDWDEICDLRETDSFEHLRNSCEDDDDDPIFGRRQDEDAMSTSGSVHSSFCVDNRKANTRKMNVGNSDRFVANKTINNKHDSMFSTKQEKVNTRKEKSSSNNMIEKNAINNKYDAMFSTKQEKINSTRKEKSSSDLMIEKYTQVMIERKKNNKSNVLRREYNNIDSNQRIVASIKKDTACKALDSANFQQVSSDKLVLEENKCGRTVVKGEEIPEAQFEMTLEKFMSHDIFQSQEEHVQKELEPVDNDVENENTENEHVELPLSLIKVKHDQEELEPTINNVENEDVGNEDVEIDAVAKYVQEKLEPIADDIGNEDVELPFSFIKVETRINDVFIHLACSENQIETKIDAIIFKDDDISKISKGDVNSMEEEAIEDSGVPNMVIKITKKGMKDSIIKLIRNVEGKQIIDSLFIEPKINKVYQFQPIYTQEAISQSCKRDMQNIFKHVLSVQAAEMPSRFNRKYIPKLQEPVNKFKELFDQFSVESLTSDSSGVSDLLYENEKEELLHWNQAKNDLLFSNNIRAFFQSVGKINRIIITAPKRTVVCLEKQLHNMKRRMVFGADWKYMELNLTKQASTVANHPKKFDHVPVQVIHEPMITQQPEQVQRANRKKHLNSIGVDVLADDLSVSNSSIDSKSSFSSRSSSSSRSSFFFRSSVTSMSSINSSTSSIGSYSRNSAIRKHFVKNNSIGRKTVDDDEIMSQAYEENNSSLKRRGVGRKTFVQSHKFHKLPCIEEDL